MQENVRGGLYFHRILEGRAERKAKIPRKRIRLFRLFAYRGNGVLLFLDRECRRIGLLGRKPPFGGELCHLRELQSVLLHRIDEVYVLSTQPPQAFLVSPDRLVVRLLIACLVLRLLFGVRRQRFLQVEARREAHDHLFLRSVRVL